MQIVTQRTPLQIPHQTGWSYQFNTNDLSGNKNNGSSACNCIFCNSLAPNRYMWPSLPLAVLCHHGTSHWQSPLLMYLSNRTFPYKLLYLNSKPLTANREQFTINFAAFPTNYQQQKSLERPHDPTQKHKKTWYTHGTSPFFSQGFLVARRISITPSTAAPLGRFGHHIGLNHLAARQNFHSGEVILNFKHLMIYTEAIYINIKNIYIYILYITSTNINIVYI